MRIAGVVVAVLLLVYIAVVASTAVADNVTLEFTELSGIDVTLGNVSAVFLPISMNTSKSTGNVTVVDFRIIAAILTNITNAINLPIFTVMRTYLAMGGVSSTGFVFSQYSSASIYTGYPSFTLLCTPTTQNTTTVYVIIDNWGLLRNASISGEGFYAFIDTTDLDINAYPYARLYINTTHVIFVYESVPVAPGQTTIRALVNATLLDNTTIVKWIECSLITKILLAVPDTITTYSPNVTITGYVYDYYTGRPLQGIVLDVYLGDEKIASVVSGPDGSFTVYVVLGEPGTYTLRYVWNGVEAGKTTIVYMGGGELREFAETVTKNIEVAFRRVPVSVPGIAIPRPTLDTPQAILLAGGVAALWAWMANTVSLSYATVVTGFILAVLGIVYGNAAMIAAGAAAMVAGYMIRRSLEQ